ncbi:MAG: hypothetical protein HC795_01115 [Coleofasciculaceae cyanobacterium RL_1_1]|nr:hypothetical protein [Coleofasciculaceae cyanobacterium RL_1_1]
MGQTVTIDPAMLSSAADLLGAAIATSAASDQDETDHNDAETATPVEAGEAVETGVTMVRVCDPAGDFLGIARMIGSETPEVRLRPKMVYLPA